MNEVNETVEAKTAEELAVKPAVKGEKTTVGRLRKIDDRVIVSERELVKAHDLLMSLIVGRGGRGGPITKALDDLAKSIESALAGVEDLRQVAAEAVEVRIENE